MELSAELKSTLDEVVTDLRLIGATKRRLRGLMANATEDEKSELKQLTIAYLGSNGLGADDPLTEAVLDAMSKETAKRHGSHTPPQKQGRDFKGRRLEHVPHGLAVTYDGMDGVVRSGWLYLDDGQRFDSPSPAARHASGQEAVNGWFAWRVVGDGRFLGDYYDDEIAHQPRTRQ